MFANATDATDANEETELLTGSARRFTGFCLRARANLEVDVRKRSLLSPVFDLFFYAGSSDISDDLLGLNQKVVQRITRQAYKNQSLQSILDSPLSENEIEHLIEQGKQNIEAQGNIYSSATLVKVTELPIFIRLAKARSKTNPKSLHRDIVETCKQIAVYNQRLESDLFAAKGSLEKLSPPEMSAFIHGMSLRMLNCHTTKLITRLNGFCNLLRYGASTFMAMLGLDQTFESEQAIANK